MVSLTQDPSLLFFSLIFTRELPLCVGAWSVALYLLIASLLPNSYCLCVDCHVPQVVLLDLASLFDQLKAYTWDPG